MAITTIHSTYDFSKNAITRVKVDPMTTSARTTFGGTLGVGDVGILVLDTTLSTYFFWNGTSWLPVGGYNYSGTSPIVVSGGAISLANSGVTAGTYGSSLQIPQLTVDVFGRITSISNLPASGVGTTFINAGSGLALSGVGTALNPFVLSIIDSYVRSLFSGTNGITYDNTSGNFSMSFLPDGSETKISAGTAIAISGSGTIGSPYSIRNIGVTSIDATLSGAVDLTTRYWKQGGNAFGALGVLGTTDVNELSFVQASVEVMRFTGGNLGVGRSTVPGNVTIGFYKMAVGGNIYSDGYLLSNSMAGSGNADAYFDQYGILRRGATVASDIILVDKFIVGDISKPQGGDTTYANVGALAGLAIDQLMVYVDGLLLSYGLSDRLSFTFSGSTITFSSALRTGMAIIIYKINPQVITPPSSTTAAPTSFDTTLSFTGATQQSAYDITAQVASITSALSFSFNHISSTSGFPEDMDIYVGGVLKMVVSFASDYLGQPCRFTNSPTQYNIVFQNGSVFL
jgi:hypothetical protein